MRRQVSDGLAAIIEGLAWEPPRRSVAAVHRLVREAAMRDGQSAPSDATVNAIMPANEPALLVRAHHGVKACAHGFDLLHRRAWRVETMKLSPPRSQPVIVERLGDIGACATRRPPLSKKSSACHCAGLYGGVRSSSRPGSCVERGDRAAILVEQCQPLPAGSPSCDG